MGTESTVESAGEAGWAADVALPKKESSETSLGVETVPGKGRIAEDRMLD